MKKIYLLFIAFISFTAINAQISQGGTPYSYKNAIGKEIDKFSLNALNVAQLLKEDAENAKYGKIERAAIIRPVELTLYNSGTWTELPNGDRVWRLEIEAKEAQAITLHYENFSLPEGAKLFVYNPEYSQIIGAFTSENNHESKIFTTELIFGDKSILEYYEPAVQKFKGSFTINGVAQFYKKAPWQNDINGFGDSDGCQVNINCSPEGTNWQDEKRGVARIYVVAGSSAGWCSGSLVNNTNLDCTPYFLTAFHCGEGSSTSNFLSWVFYFNYEASGCNNPSSQPSTSNSITGCSVKSSSNNGGSSSSDFLLLQLNGTIPSSYNVYYNGWNRALSSTLSTDGVGIHHPSGDIKKISTYTQTLTTTGWNGSGLSSHWQVYWAATTNGHGVTEGGSSGSPLFNDQGQIIGTLTGGGSYCSATNQPDNYGKVSYHWNSNGTASNRRLDIWLDPAGSGSATSLAGTYAPCSPSTPLDAGISAINNPNGTSCGGTFTPEVVLKNYGSSTLTSCAIKYRIDAGTLQTYNWSGNLATNATATVTLNAMTTTNGAHTFTAYTQNPNGGTDGNSANDSQTSNFTTSVGTALPLTQGFQSTTFPPTGYSLSNADNSTTWARTTAAGSGSTASMFMDNWDYNGTGAYDWFILPSLNFTGVTAASLSFDYAYAYYNGTQGTYYDSLAVAYSTDCGNTWYALFFEGGAQLATAGGLGTEFTPSSTQWQNEVLDLNISAINNQANVTFAFVGINGYGNNLYVDNINIQVTSTSNPPVANFTASSTSICAGNTVSFTNTSTNNPTSYLWTLPGGTPSSSTAANPTVTYNTPGTYSVTLLATNADGSDSEVKTNYITVNANPTVSMSNTSVSCFGGSNGTATANASGGSGFTYSWTGSSSTSATATGLSAGSYTVTATNSNGCFVSGTTTVSQPSAALAATVSTVNDVCNSGNGNASVSASGGTPPYSYNWSSGSNSNLTAGSYSVTITDSKGCTLVKNFTISNTNNTINVTVSTNPEICGQSNGSASASASGGTAPYTFQWSSGTNTGLSAGTYSVTATDANGCTGTKTFTISNTTVSFTINVQTTLAGCGLANGSATATVNGSSSGYTFTFSSGVPSGTNSVNGLAFGSYSVTATNAQGCSQTQTFNITNANAPAITSINTTNTLCFGSSDGSATATVNGGSSPYSYNWGPSTTTVNSYTGLAASNYTLMVTDNLGCMTQQNYTVGQPSAITANVTIGDEHCGQADGSLTATATGGTPQYTYLWNGVQGNSTNGLSAGNYALQITDANGCSFNSNYTVNAASNPQIIDDTISNVNCYNGSDGSITVSAVGSGNLTYIWEDNAPSATINNVSAGTYTVVITDAYGCQSSFDYTVSQPTDSMSINLTVIDNTNNSGVSSIASNVSGGTQPYNYNWNNTYTNPTITNLSAGTYSLTVTDFNGCQQVASATLGGNVGINDVDWYNYITLYPNPTNDLINVEIALNKKDDLAISVFDAIGKIIYTKHLNDFLSGTVNFNMKNEAQGVYFIKLSNQNSTRVLRFIKE